MVCFVTFSPSDILVRVMVSKILETLANVLEYMGGILSKKY